MRSTLAVILLAAAVAGCSDDSPTNPTNPTNHAPVAVDDQATTAEDAAIVVDVLANDTDADGDELTIVTASADGHEVAIEDGAVRVTPAPDFHGEITVAVAIDDGEETATSTAVITVTPVNDAPTAGAASLTTSRNAAIAIAMTGEDIEGDALTFELVDAPGNGTVSGTAPDLTYMPALDFVGADTLTYVARDGAAASEPATIAITVTPGNAPVADAITATTAEDTAVDVTLTAADTRGDTLTFVVTTPPAHGTVTGVAPDLTYTPDANFHGTDSLAYTASDGLQTSAPAAVAFTITPVNDAPQAFATVATTTEDVALPIALSGADVDGDTLTYAVGTAPAHGTVIVTGTTALYVPSTDHSGVDSFSFTVSDGAATSAPALVSLAITAVADAPVALAQAVGATEDQPRAIALAATDVDSDALTYQVTAAPAHGTLTGTAPALVYTPAANYHGADSFSFVASDGGLTSAPATVAITLAPVNDPPTGVGGTIALLEDQTITFNLPGSDVDGDSLSYGVQGGSPHHGTLSGSGATRTYVPDPDTHGNDAYEYWVNDGQSGTYGIVTLAVASVNDAPVARHDVAMVAPGGTVTIGVVDNDDDVDSDSLTITVAAAGAHGDVEIAGGDLVYTPDPGFTGSDAFTYTIDDGDGATATASVHVGIGQFPNTVPLAWIAPSSSGPPWSAGHTQDLTPDGRFLAFVSADALVPGDTNEIDDVYVHDRLDGGFELISVSSAGVQSNSWSGSPSISADGRYVAFGSWASNLGPVDVNTYYDVFVHDRVTGTTVCASVRPDGSTGSLPSGYPRLSADGTLVAFHSRAPELIAGDTNGESDVFIRDLVAGVTTRVSVTSAGTQADHYSNSPALTPDGRFVAFSSFATNLVPGDSWGSVDIFVHDRVTGVTERVSVTSTGVGMSDSMDPSLSDDGRYVAFRSFSINQVPGATHSGSKAFIRDRQESTTTWAYSLSSESAWVEHLDISGDGRYLTGHLENGAAWIRDLVADLIHEISTPDGADVYWPVLSKNGRHIAVISEDALVPLPPGTTDAQAYVLPNPL